MLQDVPQDGGGALPAMPARPLPGLVTLALGLFLLLEGSLLLKGFFDVWDTIPASPVAVAGQADARSGASGDGGAPGGGQSGVGAMRPGEAAAAMVHPASQPVVPAVAEGPNKMVAGLVPLPQSGGGRLLMLVLLAGALGSMVHVATSFADYVGNRQLASSWAWWLILRTPIGAILAMLFYLVMRGGVLQTANVGSDPFGAAGMGMLVGMFSKQATDKLNELFTTLFKTTTPVERRDALNAKRPAIRVTEPKVLTQDKTESVTVTGDHFTERSVVQVNGKLRQTTFPQAGRLVFSTTAEDVKTAGKLAVTVLNPADEGGASASYTLEVKASAS